ncbi:MAG: branched-chain amino acid ABC transporter permease, partial [Coriobacteriaceae bacterium]|nr:branched-chain amino acid ABC transporter permease [Coriobacteriaceae bacterium]
NRIGVGYGITDEIFGIAIARPIPLVPAYSFIAGNALPANVVAALSVSLFGMFLAIIMPEARRNRVVLACVAVGFAASYVFSRLVPVTAAWTPGNRTIVLTLVIAGIAAFVAPVPDGPDAAAEEGGGDDR